MPTKITPNKKLRMYRLWGIIIFSFPYALQAQTSEQKSTKDKLLETINTTATSKKNDSFNNDDRLEKRYRRLLSMSDNVELKQKIKIKLAIKLIQRGEVKIAEGKTLLSNIPELNDAIALLKPLTQTIKNSKETPHTKASVLYFLAKAYALNSDHEKSQQTLIQLTQNYPQSVYFAESSFRVAEDQFSKKQYRNASQYYKQTTLHKNSKFYINSMYMLGWSLYKNGRFTKALMQFKRLLDNQWEGKRYSDNILTENIKKIEDDSIRALALSIDRANTEDDLDSVTKPIENALYEPIVYKKLASIYQEQKRYQDASAVYWLYSKKHPDKKSGFIFANQSNDILKNSGLTSVYIKDEEKLTSQYGKDSPYYQSLNTEEKVKASSILEVKSLSIAEYHYKNALKSKDYTSAIFWHKEFIKNHQESRHLGQILYALGDMYEKTKQQEQAYSTYYKLAYETSSELNESAAYSAFLISKKMAESTPDYDVTTINVLSKEIDTKENIKPNQNNNKGWHFRYYLNAYLLSSRHPNHQQAINALMNASQFSAKNQRWNMTASLANYAKETNKPSNHRLTQMQLTMLIAQAKFNQKNYSEAIENYSLAQEEYKNIEQNTKNNALYQTASQQLVLSKYLLLNKKIENNSIGNNERLTFIKELASQNQNQKIKRKSSLQLIEYYINRQNYHLARDSKESFEKSFPKDKMLIPLSAQLALKYEEKKDWENALKQTEYIYNNTKNSNEKREANWNLAQWQEKLNNQEQSIFWYKKYVNSYKKPEEQNIEAQNSLQLFYQKLSKSNKRYAAKRKFWLKSIVSDYKNHKKIGNPRINTIAAQAVKALADYDFERFIAKKITPPIEKSFSQKNNMMKKAINNYQKAIDFNIADVTSSCYFQLAEMYNHLAQSMLEAPLPSGLSELEKEEYVILLEEQAYPFEEKSISIHEKNSQLSFNGIYNSSVKNSFKKLSLLLPARYNKSEIELDYIDETIN